MQLFSSETDRHFIVDETGKEIVPGNALISTCRCGHILTAVSSNERAAKKLIRPKFKRHMEDKLCLTGSGEGSITAKVSLTPASKSSLFTSLNSRGEREQNERPRIP